MAADQDGKDAEPQSSSVEDETNVNPDLTSDLDRRAMARAEQLRKGAKLKSENDLYAILHTKAREEQKCRVGQDHRFWDTQPVPKLSEPMDPLQTQGEIDPNSDISRVNVDPDPLPSQFEWCDVNIDDDTQVQEVYELLCNNYVEDDDSMFRFDYSTAFLRWVLSPPGCQRFWNCGVRVKTSHKLVGFISGIPSLISINSKPTRVAEINFLCVHKKLRSKRLAPVLIKEITRRINLKGIWQAVRMNCVFFSC
eukprot:GHVL01010307.1.p1 GENE.GHVL01010307.1~~GHVL01010307.1.p1  ORF type:complete len:252 (+),score=29.82 GHVL01010307.1:41-796(+)